ncbi:MAG: hypothetical protein AB2556_26060 [Candidatus Thiodiazotropha sp.]
MCIPCLLKEEYLPSVAPALWRDKGEKPYMPMEHAPYLVKPDNIKNEKDLTPSTAPRHDDPLSRHRLSYLNGGRGSGKTTRAIELFRQRNPLVFTPTHRLARKMRTRGVQPQTYHSFFRWSGQTEWTPERMGQIHFSCDHLGRGLHSAPPRFGNLPRLAVATRGRQPGAASPQSPEKCRTTGSASMPATMKKTR